MNGNTDSAALGHGESLRANQGLETVTTNDRASSGVDLRRTMAWVHRACRIRWQLVLVLLSWFGATATAEDWPQWRGPNRDGVWRETGIRESLVSERPLVRWRVPVGRGWSSPILANGRVYVTDVVAELPTARERVLCFEATSGKSLWIHEYVVKYPEWAFDRNAGGPRATPICRDGRLYTLGCLGDLLCLDAITGQIVWVKDLAKEYGVKEFSGITASPLIEDGLLILNIFAASNACVVAFFKDTGVEAWRALNDTFTYSTPSVLTAGGHKQLIVWSQEAVTSLDPKTGATWWREMIRTPGDMAVSTPVFAGHLLFVGGLMLRLDSEKPAASVIWPESTSAVKRVLSNTSTAILEGGYVFSARISGELVCLEAGTGKPVWQTNTVTSAGNGSCIHITPNAEGVLLFTDQGNLIRGRLSADGYREFGRVHLLDPTHPFNGRNVVWPPPAYGNRQVFVRNDSELVCASLAVTP